MVSPEDQKAVLISSVKCEGLYLKGASALGFLTPSYFLSLIDEKGKEDGFCKIVNFFAGLLGENHPLLSQGSDFGL